MMMNPKACRWVKASFLQTQYVVSVRLVRIALWVCKLLFKVEMQLKYEDICHWQPLGSVLCCGAAVLSRVLLLWAALPCQSRKGGFWCVAGSPILSISTACSDVSRAVNSKDVAKPSKGTGHSPWRVCVRAVPGLGPFTPLGLEFPAAFTWECIAPCSVPTPPEPSPWRWEVLAGRG